MGVCCCGDWRVLGDREGGELGMHMAEQTERVEQAVNGVNVCAHDRRAPVPAQLRGAGVDGVAPARQQVLPSRRSAPERGWQHFRFRFLR